MENKEVSPELNSGPGSPKKIISPAVKGIFISLVLIVISLITQFLDLSGSKSIGALQGIVLLAGVVWSAISYARQMDANVTFGNVFAHAFKTAAAVTAIMVIYTVIALKFISPEEIDKAMDIARTDMEKRNMSDEQIDQALSISKKFFFPFAIGGVLFIDLFVGVIGGLIGAGIAKKNPRGPFVQ